MGVSKMLTGHFFFSSFLPEDVAAISKFASARTLDKGEIIYGPDRKATHVFVLLDGQVELRLPSGTDEMGFLVSRVSKGEFFGVAPLLGGERYTTSARCTKASKVLFVEAKPLIDVLSGHPLIGLKMMSVVARAYFDRYQSLIDRVQRALSDLAVEK